MSNNLYQKDQRLISDLLFLGFGSCSNGTYYKVLDSVYAEQIGLNGICQKWHPLCKVCTGPGNSISDCSDCDGCYELGNSCQSKCPLTKGLYLMLFAIVTITIVIFTCIFFLSMFYSNPEQTNKKNGLLRLWPILIMISPFICIFYIEMID